MTPRYSEDESVERPAIDFLGRLGWTALNCYHEVFGENGTLGRETKHDVVLARRLCEAIRKLNPGTPEEAVGRAVEELVRDRSAMSLVEASREIYGFLKDGVPVKASTRGRGVEDEEETVRLSVVDWDEPRNNDFLMASQLWVTGEMYTRRADLVGFVNGLPLVFIELKAAHRCY